MGDKIVEKIFLTCKKEKDLDFIAEKLFDFACKIKLWLFVGDLGTCKTTLIKKLCKYLGVKDKVSSPTFSIINEYLTKKKSVFHFDFYRLNNLEEALEIGINEYFNLNTYCFIEWPQQVEELLPEEFLLIKINMQKDGKRNIEVTKYE